MVMGDIKDLMWYLLYCVVLVGLFSLLCGCSPKVITVPEYHTEYVYKTDSVVKRDSIWCYDSVFVEKAGDTVAIYKTKILYRDRWKEVVKVDTILKRDSIPYLVEVEKSLTWWQKKKIEFGEWAIVAIVCLLLLYFIRRRK